MRSSDTEEETKAYKNKVKSQSLKLYVFFCCAMKKDEASQVVYKSTLEICTLMHKAAIHQAGEEGQNLHEK